MTQAETFIFCDDDMILPCGNEHYINTKFGAGLPSHVASRLAFSRIMSHGRDKGIVGALYFGRNSQGQAQCQTGFDSPTENAKFHTFKYDGLVPQKWTATGLIKIERWVFEKMKAAIDGGKWPECKPLQPNNQNELGQCYGFFEHIATAVGEDASFGVRANEIGIQSYVDAGLVCLHAGGTYYGPNNTKFK
jgi:hypothetical protein